MRSQQRIGAGQHQLAQAVVLDAAALVVRQAAVSAQQRALVRIKALVARRIPSRQRPKQGRNPGRQAGLTGEPPLQKAPGQTRVACLVVGDRSQAGRERGIFSV